MICPHCQQAFHDSPGSDELLNDTDGDWHIEKRICPACERAVFHLLLFKWSSGTRGTSAKSYEAKRLLIYPRGIVRTPPSKHVTTSLAEDYLEACAILTDSPKASAALGRRCLQQMLRDKAGTTKKDLADQIDEVLASKQLPTHLAEAIDAIRHIGNFAAHPLKSKSTGEIAPVEPGEAEWTLDTLERLFDFYFVQPAKTQERRDALNKKLHDLGKPSLKGPTQ